MTTRFLIRQYDLISPELGVKIIEHTLDLIKTVKNIFHPPTHLRKSKDLARVAIIEYPVITTILVELLINWEPLPPSRLLLDSGEIKIF